MKFQTSIVLAAVTAGLGGCAHTTIAGAKSEKPVTVEVSPRSVPELATCIGAALDRMKVTGNFTPSPTGGQIAVTLGGGWSQRTVPMVIELVDRGSDRSVTVWQLHALFNGRNERFLSRLRACR